MNAAMTIATCPSCGAKNRVDETRADVQPVCGRCKTPLGTGAGAASNGHPVELTDATFDQVVRSAGDKLVLVDAWAAWCGPCRMIAPTIESLAAESNGRWLVGKLDVDRNPMTAQRYRIASIPTLLIFKGGQLVQQLVGLQPKPAIQAALEAHAR
jgi:thioredoxin